MCKSGKYIYWVKKRLVWVVLDRGERDKANEIGLKEGGGIEMSIYSASHIRDARAPSLKYSPCVVGVVVRMIGTFH